MFNPDQKRTLIFTGAGFSKELTRGSRISLPITNEVLCEDYLNFFLHRDESIQEILGLGKEYNSCLETLLRTVLCCEFEGYTDPFTGATRLHWFDPLTIKPFNFETLYGYCDLQSKNPLLSLSEKHLFEYALFELQVYLRNLLNVEMYYRHEFAWDELKTFLEHVDCHQSTSNSKTNTSIYFTANFDNLIESVLTVDKSDRSSELVKLAYGLLGQSLNQELDNHFSTNNSWLAGPRFAKLHGSITYFVCTNSACKYSSSPSYSPVVHPTQSPCPNCGARTIPGIIPPTSLKDYSKSSYYSRQLHYLMQALSTATRVIIAGYSFPEHDALLNNWFLYSLRRNYYLREMVVINKSEEDRQRIQGFFMRNLGDKAKHLNDGPSILGFPSIKDFNVRYHSDR